jgi:hypothetical protein
MRRIGLGVVAVALTQQLGEGPAVIDFAREAVGPDPAAVRPEQRAVLGLALLQAGRTVEGLALLEQAGDPHAPVSEQANVGMMLAFGLLAAGRAEEAVATLDRVAADAGTYVDRAWAGVARAFARLQLGDGAGVESCLASVLGEVEATEDVLLEAAVRLARRVALEVGALPGADRAATEAEDRLAALGVGLPGWELLFRLAAGAEPARDPLALAT